VWGIWYLRWSSHCVGNDMQLDEMVCSAVFVLYKHERHRNKICLYNVKVYENSFKPSIGWLWWFLKRHYITNKWKFSEILSVPTREMDRFWEMCMDCGQRATCMWGFGGIITVSYSNLNTTYMNTLQCMYYANNVVFYFFFNRDHFYGFINTLGQVPHI
jgi:hypothetical protein